MAKVKASDFCLIYVTTSSKNEANSIARNLIESNNAACANIIDHMRSMYRWQGTIESARECVLIVKTRKSKLKAAERQIKALHSYQCPCIIALPMVHGTKEYLTWLNASLHQIDKKNQPP